MQKETMMILDPLFLASVHICYEILANNLKMLGMCFNVRKTIITYAIWCTFWGIWKRQFLVLCATTIWIGSLMIMFFYILDQNNQ